MSHSRILTRDVKIIRSLRRRSQHCAMKATGTLMQCHPPIHVLNLLKTLYLHSVLFRTIYYYQVAFRVMKP
jgi:hypothetical protein